ncbi:MAG: HlyD family efflux transporter periplasmic adaptor subunit [bacterium]|nr:HlyD family efflux transporter periplasmic adaptor subunit [bacterium]
MTKSPIVILILFLLLTLGCADNQEPTGGSGILEADEIIVSAETGGRVQQINFVEGSRISKGDTLLVIDPSKLLLQLESVRSTEKVATARLSLAEIQLAKAKEAESYLQKEQRRLATLLKSGTGTAKQLDQIEHELAQATLNGKTSQSNLDVIEAEIKNIQTQAANVKRMIADCYPLSGMDGIVTEKFIEQGELLAPGKPIAKISDLTSLNVKVYLPTTDFSNIKIGDTATIDIENESDQYSGEVVWTAEEAEFTPKNIQTKKSRANLVYAVKIRIENKDGNLKIGMPVYISF